MVTQSSMVIYTYQKRNKQEYSAITHLFENGESNTHDAKILLATWKIKTKKLNNQTKRN